jgi:hypothetical protein
VGRVPYYTAVMEESGSLTGFSIENAIALRLKVKTR